MSKKGSTLMTRLLDDYISAAKQGHAPDHAEILTRCPEADREDLRFALIGADSLVEHYRLTYVSPTTVESTLAGIRRIQARKQRLQEAERRLATLRDPIHQDPIDLLQRRLEFSQQLVQEAQVARQLSAARSDRGPATVWRRGNAAPSQRTSRMLSQQARHLLEQQMAERATALLERHNLMKISVDVDALARRLGLAVQDVFIEEDIDGCLLAEDDFGAILLNRRKLNRQRRRFTLAHEISHFILHRKLRVFRDVMNEMGITSDDYEEAQANALAAMLLMPPDLIPRSFSNERVSFSHADQLADMFDVSLLAALRRLVRISDHACALVVLRDGRIRWWVESNQFDHFIPINRAPDPHSAAGLLMKTAERNPTLAERMEDATFAPLAYWADVRNEEALDTQVWEESRWLPGGYVYSLITCLD